MMKSDAVSEWVGKNLLQIVCGTAVIFAGYQTGKVEQTAKSERNLEAIQRIDRRVSERLDFMNATRNRLELLCEENERCRKRYPPMDIPE